MSIAKLCLRALKAGWQVAPKRMVAALVLILLVPAVASSMMVASAAREDAVAAVVPWCEEFAGKWLPQEPVEFAVEFIDPDAGQLDKLRAHLEARGYSFDKIYRSVCSHCDTKTLRMLVTEEHTPHSFCARDEEYVDLARNFGLEDHWNTVPTDADLYDDWSKALADIRNRGR